MDYADEPIYPDPMRGAEQSYSNQTPNDLPTGLSKKEYFAGLAMQGILASNNSSLWDKPDTVAEKSIKYANELLKQLENKK